MGFGRETVEEFRSGQNDVSKFPLPINSSPVSVVKYVVIRADLGNAGNLYVGPSSVAVGRGFLLDASEVTPPIPIDSLDKIYVVSDQNGTNEVQTVSIDTGTDNGTFTLTYDSETTGTINYDAAAAAVKSALEGLPNIDLVSVTGGPGPGTDWIVEFQGQLAAQNLPSMTGDGSSAGRNEVQTVSIDSATSSGTFTLSFDGQGPTSDIAWNANAAAVKSALEGLSNIDLVSVTGGPGPGTDWIVEFQGVNKNTNVILMTGNGTNLVGGTTTVSIVETTAGISTTVVVVETTPGDPAYQTYSWVAI